MWTIIYWYRKENHWTNMHGYSDEDTATEVAKQVAKNLLPIHIISLSDNKGEIVWAEIGSHPVIGHCNMEHCWCRDFPAETDHTLELGSSNT